MSKKSMKNNLLATGVIAGMVLFAPMAAAPAMASAPSLDPVSKTASHKGQSNANTKTKFTTKRDTKNNKSFYIDGEFIDSEALLQDSITEAYSEYGDFFEKNLLEDDPLASNWQGMDIFDDPFQDIYPDEYLNSSTR